MIDNAEMLRVLILFLSVVSIYAFLFYILDNF